MRAFLNTRWPNRRTEIRARFDALHEVFEGLNWVHTRHWSHREPAPIDDPFGLFTPGIGSVFESIRMANRAWFCHHGGESRTYYYSDAPEILDISPEVWSTYSKNHQARLGIYAAAMTGSSQALAELGWTLIPGARGRGRWGQNRPQKALFLDAIKEE